jgi:hypothetical protein
MNFDFCKTVSWDFDFCKILSIHFYNRGITFNGLRFAKVGSLDFTYQCVWFAINDWWKVSAV